jgi:hypothetical protein
VLEKEEKIIGIEIKYSSDKYNKAFKNRYPEATVKNINTKNFY